MSDIDHSSSYIAYPYLYVVESFVDAGEYESALSMSRNATCPPNQRNRLDLLISVCYIQLGAYSSALKQLREACRDDQNVAAHLNAGIAYLSLDMPKEATKELSKCLYADPRNVQANYYQAVLFRQQGDFGRALLHLAYCLDDDPQFIDAALLQVQIKRDDLNEWEQVRVQLENLINNFPDHVEVSHALANLYYKFGNSERAIELLKPHLLSDRDHVPSLLLASRILFKAQGEANESLYLVDEALLLRPCFEGYKLKAQIAATLPKKQELLAEMLIEINQLIKDEPYNTHHLLLKALLLFHLGDPDVDKLLSKIQQSDPKLDLSWKLSMKRTSEKEKSAKISQWVKAANSAPAILHKIQHSLADSNPDKILNSLDELCQLFPGYYKGHVFRANTIYIHSIERDTQNCVSAWEIYRKQFPHLRQISWFLARGYYYLGKFSESIAELDFLSDTVVDSEEVLLEWDNKKVTYSDHLVAKIKAYERLGKYSQSTKLMNAIDKPKADIRVDFFRFRRHCYKREWSKVTLPGQSKHPNICYFQMVSLVERRRFRQVVESRFLDSCIPTNTHQHIAYYRAVALCGVHRYTDARNILTTLLRQDCRPELAYRIRFTLGNISYELNQWRNALQEYSTALNFKFSTDHIDLQTKCDEMDIPHTSPHEAPDAFDMYMTKPSIPTRMLINMMTCNNNLCNYTVTLNLWKNNTLTDDELKHPELYGCVSNAETGLKSPKGLETVEIGIKLLPPNPTISTRCFLLHAKAGALQFLGNYKVAAATLHESIQLQPLSNLLFPKLGMATASLNLGHLEEAQKWIEQCAVSQASVVWTTMATIQYTSGNLEAAEQALYRAEFISRAVNQVGVVHNFMRFEDYFQGFRRHGGHPFFLGFGPEDFLEDDDIDADSDDDDDSDDD